MELTKTGYSAEREGPRYRHAEIVAHHHVQAISPRNVEWRAFAKATLTLGRTLKSTKAGGLGAAGSVISDGP